MADIIMKKGDSLPSIQATLIMPDGADLSLATSVTFQFEPIGGGSVVSGLCVVVDALNRKVRYDWGGSDTVNAGDFRAEFLVNFSGRQERFPNDGYLSLKIQDNVT